MCITLNISQNLWNYVLNYITNCSSYSIDFIWNVRLYRVDGSICSRKYKTINYSPLFFRLRSHGTGQIRDCSQIRPLTAVHTKPDKLQAKKCSHGAGRICTRNYLLNFVVCYLQFFMKKPHFFKNLHCGKTDAGAPDIVICCLLSKHFFRLSFKFFRFLCRKSTEMYYIRKILAYKLFEHIFNGMTFSWQ